jgi:hypothetical protein
MADIITILNLTLIIINVILIALNIRYTKVVFSMETYVKDLMILEIHRNPSFLHNMGYSKSMEKYLKK